MPDVNSILHRLDKAEPEALSHWPSLPEPGSSRLKVLVVEDNPDSATAISLLLELVGHEVRVSESGAGVTDRCRCGGGIQTGRQALGRRLIANGGIHKVRS